MNREFDSVHTMSLWLTSASPSPGGYFKWIDHAIDSFNISAYNGTQGNPIILNGRGFKIKGDQTYGDNYITKNFTHGSTITMSTSGTHQYSIVSAGSTLHIPEGATCCRVYNDTIQGTWDIDETTGDCYNVAVPGTVELANNKTLNCNNCYFSETEATIETPGGTVTGNNNQFSIIDFGFTASASPYDFSLTSGSCLIDSGVNTPGLSADIYGIKVPFNNTPDVGAYEYYDSLFTITGNNTEINYSTFDGQNEIIGIVVPSIYSGTKIQNITAIGCKLGINAGGDVELSNSILWNETGNDIFINESSEVTVSGANYIQDSVKVGDGSYTTGGYTTTWNGSDPFRRPNDLNLDINSTCINTGNNSIWSGVVDVTDVDSENITDSSGNIVVPGGTVDIGAYEKYWKEKITKTYPGKILGITRVKIGKVMGRQ